MKDSEEVGGDWIGEVRCPSLGLLLSARDARCRPIAIRLRVVDASASYRVRVHGVSPGSYAWQTVDVAYRHRRSLFSTARQMEDDAVPSRKERIEMIGAVSV